jgi:hypothetical protein
LLSGIVPQNDRFTIEFVVRCHKGLRGRFNTLKKLPQKYGELYYERSVSIPHWYNADCLRVVSMTVSSKRDDDIKNADK